MRTKMSFMLSDNERANRAFHAIKHALSRPETQAPMAISCGSCGARMTNNIYVCSTCWNAFSKALFGDADTLNRNFSSLKPLIKATKHLTALKRYLMLNKLDEL